MVLSGCWFLFFVAITATLGPPLARISGRVSFSFRYTIRLPHTTRTSASAVTLHVTICTFVPPCGAASECYDILLKIAAIRYIMINRNDSTPARQGRKCDKTGKCPACWSGG